MMALSTLKELREALILLREDERERQNILAKQISKRGVKKKNAKKIEEEDDEEEDLFGPDKGDDKKDDSDSEEKDSEEPESSDDEGDDSEKDVTDDEEESGEKDQALAGARELNDIPQEVPETLKGNNFVDRINKIRAGASVKDTDVRDRIVDYVNRLTSSEQNDLYIHLDSLARIILGGVDPAEVLTPTMITKKSNDNSDNKKVSKSNVKQDKSTVAGPVVVVKEGIRKQYVEIPVVLKNGRSVPFGHKLHIKDTNNLLTHLLNYRMCQEPRSADDFAISTAIKIVKKQLASAQKKLSCKQQEDNVDIDPLIELLGLEGE